MARGTVQGDLATLFPATIRRSAGTGAGESFLAYALDQHALVSVTNAKEEIVYVNDRFAEISGYSRCELIGNTHRILRSGDQPAALFEDIWSTIRSGLTWAGEVKQVKKSGEHYWAKTTIVPFFSPSGQPEKFLSIHTDITEVKSAEANLQRQMSFDHIKDEIYLFWPETLEVFYTNRSARIRLRALGRATTDLTPCDLLEGHSKQEMLARLNGLLAGGRKWLTFEAEQRRPDGRTTPAEVTIQLMRPRDESPRFLAHVRDISQRKQAEIAKQQFVANVSHELRTPLTAIKGAFGLINTKAEGGTGGTAGRLADMGLKNTARLEYLIENLLDVERIATGRMTSRLTRVNLDQVITEAISDVAAYKPEKNIRVRYNPKKTPICVKGDEAGLFKVFGILLTNAVRFSDPESEVEVRAQQDGARIAVSVIDQGIGISERFLKNIFQPFTQADQSDTRKSDGAGLGLVIARSIVEAHGGAIKVQSVEGQGSEFSFYLIPCV
ncbi:MAG: PAS domain-containing sensor histidine kinase [Antarcticimicrobium sp.]|uniref:PAS domain-containing sensor histidine kinase n=1 Tax=Antarcticimicrobium sp. TaxID=2824147 RepID=UPI002602BBD5|nr:PAS domain-containing sensor histidine kinase [Antarcticimicrobium sp.]MDF1715506.1 PAS domain-containing sensor histidine kinase [Antarcticimicrobium sp.]